MEMGIGAGGSVAGPALSDDERETAAGDGSGDMLSVSALRIAWRKPVIEGEEWEFFRHPAKQDYYCRHGIAWEGILASFDSGTLVPYPRSNRLMGVPVSLSYDSYDDYSRFLAKAKRGYRRSYAKMEEELQRAGALALPAPIILRSGREALLFSGYRRLCLAWNYGMVPFVWLVSLPQTTVLSRRR